VWLEVSFVLIILIGSTPLSVPRWRSIALKEIVVGISKIEDYRRTMRQAKRSVVQVATSATWLV
jgi:hypothetical protein